MQKVADIIKQRLDNLKPILLQVDNDSHLHQGTRTESHFKVLIVSERFVGLNLIQRHRLVYEIIGDVMQKIHALQLNTWTPEQFEKKGSAVVKSSVCAKS